MKNILPNIRTKDWKLLRRRIEKNAQEFKDIKNDLRLFYRRKVEFDAYDELGGERQSNIIRKLFHYPGDITPAMLLNLVKDVTEHTKQTKK